MSELIHTVEVLGRAIVLWSWQLAIFIGFLWLVVRMDRRHRPEFRYRLWAAALVISLFLPWMLQGIASYSWTIRAKEAWIDTHPFDSPKNERSYEPGPQIGETKRRPLRLQPSQQEVTPTRWPSLAVVYRCLGFQWILGIGVGAARKVREHHRMQAIVERARPFTPAGDSRVPILLSREVSSPLLYGTFGPVILLPHDIDEWSTAEERDAIIRHEHIHFEERHHWVASLETLAVIMLFFHPLFRWMCAQLDRERELVCDAEILRMGVSPDRYAETLLLVARQAISGHAGMYFAARAQLERRIELLFRPLRRARLAVATVPILFLTPLLALGFWQTRAERLEPIQTEWLTRLLPVLPREVPEGVTLATLSRKPVGEALFPKQVTPTPPQPVSSGFRTVVSLFKGQEIRTSEVHIALAIPHSGLGFAPNGGTLEASGRYEMRIATLSGTVVARAEESFQIDLPASTAIPSTGLAGLEHVFQVGPGAYSISAVVTDLVTGSTLGLVERRLEIPAISPSLHSASSLVLADMIQSGNPSSSSSFRLGDFRVRPNFTGKLRRDQELKLVQQVYNPASASLTYETVITTVGREVKRVREDLATAPELTVIKTFALSDLPPGSYEVETMVTDPRGLKVGARAQFSLE